PRTRDRGDRRRAHGPGADRRRALRRDRDGRLDRAALRRGRPRPLRTMGAGGRRVEVPRRRIPGRTARARDRRAGRRHAAPGAPGADRLPPGHDPRRAVSHPAARPGHVLGDRHPQRRTGALMTRAIQGVFAVLVVATVGAFFLAQRVKSTPAAIKQFSMRGFCSPNGDGRFDGCRLSLRIKHADDVTVRVVGPEGDAVRTLIADRTLAPRQQLRVLWNGRTDGGAPAEDGTYRFQVNLRSQGRSILIPRTFAVDTTAPKPIVTSIGPTSTKFPRPELFPNPQGKPLE